MIKQPPGDPLDIGPLKSYLGLIQKQVLSAMFPLLGKLYEDQFVNNHKRGGDGWSEGQAVQDVEKIVFCRLLKKGQMQGSRNTEG